MGWGNKWNWNGTSGFEKQNHRYFTVCCIASIELHNSSDRAESFDNLSEDKKMSRKIETFYSRITAKYFSKIFAQKTPLSNCHIHMERQMEKYQKVLIQQLIWKLVSNAVMQVKLLSVHFILSKALILDSIFLKTKYCMLQWKVPQFQYFKG